MKCLCAICNLFITHLNKGIFDNVKLLTQCDPVATRALSHLFTILTFILRETFACLRSLVLVNDNLSLIAYLT